MEEHWTLSVIFAMLGVILEEKIGEEKEKKQTVFAGALKPEQDIVQRGPVRDEAGRV
ncbi:hypothetical protein [Listeria monocytogenes]|uniref:hypothetical protein n=1 Tax=Listeria monocytogenes TaxID=1639 RepID=UPI00350E3BF8